MTREMINMIKTRKQEAAELIHYAAPKNGRNMKNVPTIERIGEIIIKHIPYNFSEGRPEITNIKVADYHKNDIIKGARFHVTLANGKVWEIWATKNLKDLRTPEEKEADRTADFPTTYFVIFHTEITHKVNGGEPAPVEVEKTNPWLPVNDAQKSWSNKWANEQEVCDKICNCHSQCTVADRQNENVCLLLRGQRTSKAITFEQTTKGWIGKVNDVVVWFIRHETNMNGEKKQFMIYKSEDGGVGFRLIPANETLNVARWGKDTLEAAKAFIYQTELRKAG